MASENQNRKRNKRPQSRLWDILSISLVIGTGIVNQKLVSKFPYDQRILLSDPHFESRLSTYLIRLEFVSGEATELLENQAALITLIESATLQ